MPVGGHGQGCARNTVREVLCTSPSTNLLDFSAEMNRSAVSLYHASITPGISQLRAALSVCLDLQARCVVTQERPNTMDWVKENCPRFDKEEAYGQVEVLQQSLDTRSMYYALCLNSFVYRRMSFGLT